MLNDDRRVVLLTLLAQTGVSLGVAGLLALWFGGVVAVSALLGGLVAVIPNGFLAARLLPARAGGGAGLMRSAWIGAVGKLVLTGVLFGTIFAAVRPLSVPAVFGGFISAQLVIFGALLLGGSAGRAEATNKS